MNVTCHKPLFRFRSSLYISSSNPLAYLMIRFILGVKHKIISFAKLKIFIKNSKTILNYTMRSKLIYKH